MSPASLPAPSPLFDDLEEERDDGHFNPRRDLRVVSDAGLDHARAKPLPFLDTQTIRTLALAAFEVLEGVRAVAQLGAWITPSVAETISERRALRTERRSILQDDRRVVAKPGPVHAQMPRPGVIEATVILHAKPRAMAVSIRFEHSGGRWRATELVVL